MSTIERPPLSNSACDLPSEELHHRYTQSGTETLTLRKVYGKDKIRYLRCQCCGEEFSERKNTALWNTKIPEREFGLKPISSEPLFTILLEIGG